MRLEQHINRWRGLSSEVKPELVSLEGGKPSKIPAGSLFTEIDTGNQYRWTGHEWVRQVQTIEALLGELIAGNARIEGVLRATHRGHEQHLWEDEVEIEESGDF